ncbi:hypothetical protein B0H66DRAFT_531074 [Apodospora peruviana]|uniref:Uncharacterized protein n=1 Tax=Apodospora peruviana TaxID=516989 RepID=A0AAE0IB64_9PEZI|nr:hypothetical protein B0H66DRAFT_531074 [Apodospora peruviana]
MLNYPTGRQSGVVLPPPRSSADSAIRRSSENRDTQPDRILPRSGSGASLNNTGRGRGPRDQSDTTVARRSQSLHRQLRRTTSLASRCSSSANPFPPSIPPDRSQKSALVPTRKQRRFKVGNEDTDPIGLLFFAMPLGVLTFLWMGLQEWVNVVDATNAASTDKAGSRRRRMKRGQVIRALVVRSVVFSYAVACPVLLTLGPGGLMTKSKSYKHFLAESVAMGLAGIIAMLTLFFIVDGLDRLRVMRSNLLERSKKDSDLESRASSSPIRGPRPVHIRA